MTEDGRSSTSRSPARSDPGAEKTAENHPAPASPRTSPAKRGTFFTGDLVHDRFRILRYIARGGAGEVYEALDTELRCPVALKVVRPEIARDQHAIERFRREISLARQVTHPNVCRIFDVFRETVRTAEGEQIETLFLTMELLLGETLAERIKRKGPMDTLEALPIVEDMVAGLRAAHRAGVIHRDLKSANVVLAVREDSQRAVITDFGLAHTDDPDDPAPLTQSGTVVGTPNYMAPEQLTGDLVTPFVDMYALGIVMYEMITGKRPFRGENDLSTAVKRLTEPAPSPRVYTPDLDHRWERAILRCLEKSPEDRFSDLRHLVDVLTGQRDIGVPRSHSKRPRAGFLLAAVASLLVVLAAGFRITSAIDTRQSAAPLLPTAFSSPALAIFDFANLSDDSSSQWLASALAEMLSMELSLSQELQPVSNAEVDRVAARLALDRGAGFHRDALTEIRRMLDVDLVVEGSFLATGDNDMVRLHLRLHSDGPEHRILVVGNKSRLTELTARASSEIRRELGLAQITSGVDAWSEEERLVRIGLEDVREHRLPEALQLFEQVLKINPDNAIARIQWSRARQAMGDDEGAQEGAQRAIAAAADLRREDQLGVQAHAAFIGRRFQEASELFGSLQRFYPKDPDYLVGWLDSLVRSGQAARAVDTLDALATNAKLEDLRLGIVEARALGVLRRFEAQLATAEQTSALAQDLGATVLAAEASLLASSALTSLGRLGEAEQSASESQSRFKSADVTRGVLDALEQRARIEDRRGRSERAEELRTEADQLARTQVR